ncbi:MAG: hypothetical protein ACREOS_02405 [Candidatus Dormibacteraceae bacterium]
MRVLIDATVERVRADARSRAWSCLQRLQLAGGGRLRPAPIPPLLAPVVLALQPTAGCER